MPRKVNDVDRIETLAAQEFARNCNALRSARSKTKTVENRFDLRVWNSAFAKKVDVTHIFNDRASVVRANHPTLKRVKPNFGAVHARKFVNAAKMINMRVSK